MPRIETSIRLADQPHTSSVPAKEKPIQTERAGVRDTFEPKRKDGVAGRARTSDVPQTMKLPDGRKLSWGEYGAPNGRPVLFFHGMAGSRLDAKFYAAAAKKQGVRLIAIDRPGYGSSSPSKGGMRTYLNDLTTFLSAQNLGRLPVMGWSGGATFAAALAHDHPEMVSKLTLMSPFSFSSNIAGAQRLAGLQRSLPQLASMRFDDLTSMYTDEEALLAEPKIRKMAKATFAAGKRQGSAGLEFDLATISDTDDYFYKNIKVPVETWKGIVDFVVPPKLVGANDSLPSTVKGHWFIGDDDSGHMGSILHADEVVKSTTPTL